MVRNSVVLVLNGGKDFIYDRAVSLKVSVKHTVSMHVGNRLPV